MNLKSFTNYLLKLMSIYLFISYLFLYLGALKDLGQMYSNGTSNTMWYFIAPIVIAGVSIGLFVFSEKIASFITAKDDTANLNLSDSINIGTLTQLCVFLLGLKTFIDALSGTFNTSLFTIASPMLFKTHDYMSIFITLAIPLFKMVIGIVLMYSSKTIGRMFQKK